MITTFTYSSDTNSWATGINDSGQIAGYWWSPSNGTAGQGFYVAPSP